MISNRGNTLPNRYGVATARVGNDKVFSGAAARLICLTALVFVVIASVTGTTLATTVVANAGTIGTTTDTVITSCDFASLKPGDKCGGPWSSMRRRMHTTQNAVGYSWVLYKAQKYMGSAKSAQKELNEKIVPVIKGPADGLWILDHHHVLAALDYSGYDDVSVTVSVVCDFSNSDTLRDFWQRMASTGYVYNYGRPKTRPNQLPARIDPDTMPLILSFNASESTMMDDPWRSLAGFARKLKESQPDGVSCDKDAGKYCMRAYEKVCASGVESYGIPYFEFRWGYFFNDAYLRPSSLWVGLESAYSAFKANYTSLTYKSSSDDWLTAAQALFPLARGAMAGAYNVPSSMGPCKGKLPGYSGPSLGPIATPDPDCALPPCNDNGLR